MKGDLLTKRYKTSKGEVTSAQRLKVFKSGLKRHHCYVFDTEYLSFQSTFFFSQKIQDTPSTLPLFIQFPFLPI